MKTPGSIPLRRSALWVLLAIAIATAPRLTRAQNGIVRATPVIENERVKVWDITLSPGQSTALRHENEFATMFFAGARCRTTDENGRITVAVRQFGEAVYGRRGTEQREEVISGGPARLIVVELKDHPGPIYANKSGYPPAFPRPGSTRILDNERIVVWNYSWTPNMPTAMHFHDKDVLVVFRYDGSLKSTTPDGKSVVNDYTPGSIRFNRGDRTHYEELVKGQQTGMMMELK